MAMGVARFLDSLCTGASLQLFLLSTWSEPQVLCFMGPIWLCSGSTLCGTRDLMGCWELNPGQLHARLIPLPTPALAPLNPEFV